MTFGPIDILALQFRGNQFKGEILPELLDLIERGIVTVIDLVIVSKDQDGNVASLELQELDRNHVLVANPLLTQGNGLIGQEDIEDAAAAMENNCTGAVLVFENTWAVRFKQAVLNADGQVLMQYRIPHQVVQQALDEASVE